MYRNYTVCVHVMAENTPRVQICTQVQIAHMIEAFVFAYAKSRLSHDAVLIMIHGWIDRLADEKVAIGARAGQWADVWKVNDFKKLQ